MSAALLEKAGTAMYGEGWKHKMAEDLGIGLRGLRRMATGEAPIPETMWAEIGALLDARAHYIRAIFVEIEKL